MKTILILGATGKLGTAIKKTFSAFPNYKVISKSSDDFNVLDSDKLNSTIAASGADTVINTVAKLGIDQCEKNPYEAYALNVQYPKHLAELSNLYNFTLIHFSTDAVFSGSKKAPYTESDHPDPINTYGLTKFGGDCLIQAIAKRYYIFRLSVLFGQSTKNNQFVEKMLEKARTSESISVSGDIICSPTYTNDIAYKIKDVMESKLYYGLYHLANDGRASLYDLMNQIVKNLRLDVEIKKVSYKDFPYVGLKNTYTPLTSNILSPMRSWQEAVKDYCKVIK